MNTTPNVRATEICRLVYEASFDVVFELLQILEGYDDDKAGQSARFAADTIVAGTVMRFCGLVTGDEVATATAPSSAGSIQ